MEKIFKAKRLDTGEWVVFGLSDIATSATGELWVVGNGEAILINKNTICQYTGINDSEGNRIFEGDELSETKHNSNADKGIVCWHPDGHWMCKHTDDEWGDYLEAYSSWIIVGNIHDRG